MLGNKNLPPSWYTLGMKTVEDHISSNDSVFKKHFEELVTKKKKKDSQMPLPKILIQYSWGGAHDSAF